jgi:hypothetical protein
MKNVSVILQAKLSCVKPHDFFLCQKSVLSRRTVEIPPRTVSAIALPGVGLFFLGEVERMGSWSPLTELFSADRCAHRELFGGVTGGDTEDGTGGTGALCRGKGGRTAAAGDARRLQPDGRGQP